MDSPQDDVEVTAAALYEVTSGPSQPSDDDPIDRNEDCNDTNANNIGQISSTQHAFSNPSSVNHTTHEYKNYFHSISGGNIIIADKYSDDGGFGHDPVAKKCKVTSYTNAELQERYPLVHERRGNVLIVENNFDGMEGFQLLGYKKDSQHLKKFWEDVGCKVDLQFNLNKNKMENVIKDFAKSEIHKNSDYAVLVILSHGGEMNGNGIIFAVDREKIGEYKQNKDLVSLKTKKILEYFEGKNAKHLVGKPKLIILQCCRGDKDLESVQPASLGTGAPFVAATPPTPFTIPSKCDTMVIHAATFGNPAMVSQLESGSGSVFINELIKVFNEQAENTHVADMMIKVRRNMSQMPPHRYLRDNENRVTSQISVLEDTTTRKFYLF